MKFTLAELMLNRVYQPNVRFGSSTVDELSPVRSLRVMYQERGLVSPFDGATWMHHPIFHATAIKLNTLHLVVQGWSPRNQYTCGATIRRIRKDIAIESPTIKAPRKTAADAFSETFG
jgi:hypothetical protein